MRVAPIVFWTTITNMTLLLTGWLMVHATGSIIAFAALLVHDLFLLSLFVTLFATRRLARHD